MNGERKNDIGGKILIGLIIAAFGFGVNHLVSVAYAGSQHAHKNELRIVKLEVKLDDVKDDTGEIKTMVRELMTLQRSG